MSLPCMFGGVPLLKARIAMAYVGAWHAELEADHDGETDPHDNGDGTFTLTVDGVDFIGTPTRSGAFVGRYKAQLVGGRGGINKELPPAHYTATNALTVLLDILTDAGEELSDTVDTDAIAVTEFGGWERTQAPASRALTRICSAAGLIWRVLGDGTVWVGQDSYPTTTVDHELVDEVWSEGLIEIAPTAPDLTPGITFRDQQIRYVVHNVRPTSLRTEAYLETPNGLLDKFLGGIRQSLAYSRLYPSTVVTQNADGTLQVLPDDEEMRGKGVNNVPIRLGTPGVTAKVPAGARVRLGFDDADPNRPFAALWDAGEATELVVDAETTRINPGGGELLLGDTPANPVSRVGDLVQISLAIMCPDPTKGVLLNSPVGPVTGTIGTPLLPVIAVGQMLTGKTNVKA